MARGRVYTSVEKATMVELLDLRKSASAVAREMGVNRQAVVRAAKNAGMTLRMGRLGGAVAAAELPEGEWVDAYGHLTGAARGLIAVRLRDRHGHAQIARELGVHRITVWREVDRNSVDGVYLPGRAQSISQGRRARPQPRKLDRAEFAALRQKVLDGLMNDHSPQQIAGDLKRVDPKNALMNCSHETIYQALYVQGKGSLREELAKEQALRSGRTERIPRSKLPSRGPGKSWVADAPISTRPAEVEDRAVPGHWEGDLILGARNATACITLVERTSRYLLMARLPDKHDTKTVTTALADLIATLPKDLFKTVTWDQGAEMADHASFTIATDVKVYFCDPHSPWQRGSNENINGLIRQYFPKGTNFANVTDDQIAEAQRRLNTRPRATLGYLNPAAKLDELLTVAGTT